MQQAKKRARIYAGITLVFGLILAFFIFLIIEEAKRGIEPFPVLVAKEDLDVGDEITRENTETVYLPAREFDKPHIFSSFEDIETIDRSIIEYVSSESHHRNEVVINVPKGEPITRPMLNSPEVPKPGMALAALNEPFSAPASLRPGDIVSVITQQEGVEPEISYEDLRVFAIGNCSTSGLYLSHCELDFSHITFELESDDVLNFFELMDKAVRIELIIPSQ